MLSKKKNDKLNKNPINTYYYFIGLIFSGLVVYFQTLRFDWTYLDDYNLIVANFDFISKASNIFKFFKEDVFHTHIGGSYYRPILTLSFMIDAQIGGMSPFIYHLTNILLHLTACCVVFLFFLKLNYPLQTSFLFSLIFTLHPLLTQAVAWVPGRNDILLSIFALLSFISLLYFLESKEKKFYLAHLTFFILSLFTKENAVMIPVLCFLYFHLIYDKKISFSTQLYYLFWWFLITLIWFIIRSQVLKTTIGNADYDILKSLILNFPAIIPYIGKIFFPFNLSVFPILRDMKMEYGVITIAIVILLLFISKTKRLNFVVFGIIWFVVFLLPSFIRPLTSTSDFSEHRIYLPMVGFMIILMEIGFKEVFKLKEKSFFILTSLVVILLSSITFIHSKNFKNRISFWENAVKTSPTHAFNYNNLGAMYWLEGRVDEAQKMWETAIKINPNERLVHGNLGLVHMNRGNFKEAEAEYLKEIEINPLYDNVYFNLGLLYYKQGRFKEAELMWEKTLEINPNYLDAYKSLQILRQTYLKP